MRSFRCWWSSSDPGGLPRWCSWSASPRHARLGLPQHLGGRTSRDIWSAFVAGILTYRALQACKDCMPRMALEFGLAACAVALVICPFLPRYNGFATYSLIFAAMAFCLARGAGAWMTPRWIRDLGEVS